MIKRRTEVLIVGGGGAGLMAAVRARREGRRAALVTKGLLMRSGSTVMAPGAFAAVGPWSQPGDSAARHELDTLIGGAWLNNQRIVRRFTGEMRSLIPELEGFGALFERGSDPSRPALKREGGHSFARAVYMENRIGRELMRALYGEAVRLGVEFYERVFIDRLLLNDSGVCGAAGRRIDAPETMAFESGSVILATGGAAMTYRLNDNSTDSTGDGMALALRAGASLMDMEFVQAFPIGFLAPPCVEGSVAGFLPLARLYNNLGERFMSSYDPRLEQATRDKISRAIATEVRQGRGSPLGGVYCVFEDAEPGYIEENLPDFASTYKMCGIDPLRDRIEVCPTCHFFMGGVKVDDDRQSDIPGLYAVGEAAAGAHGANRVGQNALAEMLASASIAAGHASQRNALVSGINRILEDDGGEASGAAMLSVPRLRLELQALMQQNAFVVRSGASLRLVLEGIERLRSMAGRAVGKERRHGRADIEALENDNMLLVAQCVVSSALGRTESRGAHFRTDFPEADDANWLKNTVVRRRGENLCLSYEPVEFCYHSPRENGGAQW